MRIITKLQIGLVGWALVLTSPFLFAESNKPLKVLKHSDVVTMYRADADTYEAYGIDVLAWGGKPTPETLKAIGNGRFFGSVGMVTEFNRYHEFAGDKWEEGLCRDRDGNPIKIHWLLDHQHKGIPYYFYWLADNNSLLYKSTEENRRGQSLKISCKGFLEINDPKYI